MPQNDKDTTTFDNFNVPKDGGIDFNIGISNDDRALDSVAKAEALEVLEWLKCATGTGSWWRNEVNNEIGALEELILRAKADTADINRPGRAAERLESYKIIVERKRGKIPTFVVASLTAAEEDNEIVDLRIIFETRALTNSRILCVSYSCHSKSQTWKRCGKSARHNPWEHRKLKKAIRKIDKDRRPVVEVSC
jgi:hypothetical protein